jgi:hypothetical protein
LEYLLYSKLNNSMCILCFQIAIVIAIAVDLAATAVADCNLKLWHI